MVVYGLQGVGRVAISGIIRMEESGFTVEWAVFLTWIVGQRLIFSASAGSTIPARHYRIAYGPTDAAAIGLPKLCMGTAGIFLRIQDTATTSLRMQRYRRTAST
eukprot:1787711-Rhodomonas_salina.1